MRRLPVYDPGPTLATALEQGVAVLDQHVTRARARFAAAGRHVPCKKGCSACCYHPMHIMLWEAWAIALELRTWPRARVRRVREHLSKALARASEAGLELGATVDGAGPDGLECDRYHRARIACPLLDEDGSCSVYARRPLACRGHLVIDFDPAHCAEPNPLRRVTADMLDAHAATERALVRAVEAAAELGAPSLPVALLESVPLLEALRIAWPLVEEPRLTIAAWLERLGRTDDVVAAAALAGAP